MRFTFGTFRFAARNPAFRLATAGPTPKFPNTVQSLRKAMRTYHQSGEASGRKALKTSLSGPYWKVGIGAGKAAVARQLLDDYMAINAAEGTVAAGFDIKSDLALGSDLLGVAVDVCLFAPTGYAARLVLWDKRGCSAQEARVLVAPAIVAIDEVFGNGTAERAEVVDVRAATVHKITRRSALRAIPEVQAILQRVQR